MQTKSTDHYAEYVVAWRERETISHRHEVDRATKARQACELCADLLAETYHVRKVWLFGSLLQPQEAHDRSDIDLAVEGLAPADYFAALAAIYDLVEPGIEIDLVPMDTAHLWLRKQILSEGLVLYAAHQSVRPNLELS